MSTQAPIISNPTVKRTVKFTHELNYLAPAKLLSLPARGCRYTTGSITRHRLDPLINWDSAIHSKEDEIADIDVFIEYYVPTDDDCIELTGRIEIQRRIPFYAADGTSCDSIDMFEAGGIHEATASELVKWGEELPLQIAEEFQDRRTEQSVRAALEREAA